MKVLVSACLLGLETRYDGKSNTNKKIIDYLKENKAEIFPLCPEQIGGLSTPRDPSEIENGYTSSDILNRKGRVLSKNGEDITDAFLKGAYAILKFCKEFNITHAILTEKSPSCGYTSVYDGTFSGTLITGTGITTQLLKDNGITIIDI